MIERYVEVTELGAVLVAAATSCSPTRRKTTSLHSLHNHFIVKVLYLVWPGDLVALFSSWYTITHRTRPGRRDVPGLANLLSAIRMHARPAGVAATATGRTNR
jgi:hypothetical protein